MKDDSLKRPACMTGADVSRLAQQGSARALAVRDAAIELSPEQAKEVGGGFFLLPIIFGGFPFLDKMPFSPKAPVILA